MRSVSVAKYKYTHCKDKRRDVSLFKKGNIRRFFVADTLRVLLFLRLLYIYLVRLWLTIPTVQLSDKLKSKPQRVYSDLELWQLFAITPLERSEAYRMMTSFAFALSDLHSSGDLWDHCEKGVVIDSNSRIKITGTVSNRHLRLKGAKVDPYRSIAPPEFINSGLHDERSDIFAWGIIAYELVTGECPVKGETLTELIESASTCKFPPPHHLIPDWPERLSRVIMKALSKEPNDRYQNTEDLIRAMNSIA